MHLGRHGALWAGVLAALVAGCDTDSASPGTTTGDGGGGAGGGTGGGTGGGPVGGSGGGLPVGPLDIAGCPRNYSVQATIGATQTFGLRIDTGSTTLAVAATGCSNCYGVWPLYEPGPDAIDQGETVDCTYALGTGWTGDVYQDTVALDPALATPMRLVAISQANNFFTNYYGCGPDAQGILGLGPAANAIGGTDSHVDELVAGGMPDVFAIQLCPIGGKLWLGSYDPDYSTEPPAFVPYSASAWANQHYVVDVTSFDLGDVALDPPQSAYGPAVLDTGSSITIVTDEIFTAFTTRIYADSTFVDLFGTSFFDAGMNCAAPAHSKAELDAMLPTFAVTFDGPTPLTVQSPATESYLLPITNDEGDTVYCAGIRGTDLGINVLLGDNFMMGKVLVFDRGSQQVGFAQAPCSS